MARRPLPPSRPRAPRAATRAGARCGRLPRWAAGAQRGLARLRIPGRTLALAAALLLALPAWAGPSTVIVISLDGTSPEAAREAGMETLAALGEAGARGRVVPVFPTNTFPNHVTFATGVGPDVHGIVNNVFRDPERGLFRYDDDPTWIEVEPIWSLLARQEIPSAAYHWVGSEGPWRNGFGPTEWVPFDDSVPEMRKVERILEWLDRKDPARRPRLVTTWWRGADKAAHREGLGSAAVRETLAEQDRALAALVAGLEARGLWEDTTLMVVSDHGMAPVERTVDLAAVLREAGIRGAKVLGGGGCATVWLRDPEGQAWDAARAARRAGVLAWPRPQAPPSLRVGHPRFGDLVVVAPVGTALVRELGRPGWAKRLLGLFRRGRPKLAASHGHLPNVPEMSGVFAARGPHVLTGRLPLSVMAVDVAPTILALLGVPQPRWMEGRPVVEVAGETEGGVRPAAARPAASPRAVHAAPVSGETALTAIPARAGAR